MPSLRVWVALAAVATVTALFLSYRSIRQTEITTEAVAHTQQTLSALVALEGAIADLIFSAGDPAISRASEAAVTRLENLSVLTRDNERQQQRLTLLRSEIEAVVRTRRHGPAGGIAIRDEAVVPQSLSRTMRAIRVEELTLLTSRVEASARTFRQLTSSVLITAIGSGLLVVWLFGLVRRDERKRREAEDVLRRTNEGLDHEQALRREAEASSRLKDEFLMTVSHELRTPLNALLGWADMLRRDIVSGAQRQRAADAIHENAKLQAQLIADLLDTAHILTGKLRIEPAFVDLGQIVQDAADTLAPAAAAKGLELKVEIDRHGCIFFGDAGRLRQIVWNLVSNAVKFTEHGTVSVRLARSVTDNQMTIVVADTGLGINSEFLPYVFDRFSQEKTGTTRPHGGLGLGLAIVRQLVELHGGMVRVQSPGEGHGAIFTVSLPFVSARKATGTTQTDAERVMRAETLEMPTLYGIRVLIVDDDAGAREIATVVLESCGARVTSAASAAEARTTLARNACDVLLVDLAMPYEDGYTFIRQMRTAGLRQPVAALTAQVHETDRLRATASGFDEFISKPIEPRVLAQAVAALVGNAQGCEI